MNPDLSDSIGPAFRVAVQCVIVNFDPGAKLPGFKSLLCLLISGKMRPVLSDLFSLYLSFLICNVGDSGSSYFVVLF